MVMEPTNYQNTKRALSAIISILQLLVASTNYVTIDNIIQSIQTIAKAVEQQQCNLSEASIRLYHLLEALPLIDKPDFSEKFSGLYTLYDAVKDLPTHQARKEQGKLETYKQDLQREELEAELESQILKEVAQLAAFSV